MPIVAVDTPTAVDLTSGDPSEPVVRADLTVTFHRPKTGLLTKRGAALAGKVLVAPIGIPARGGSWLMRAPQATGWREVLIVAAVAVGVVLGAAILTAVLPTDAQRVIFHTPLLIGVLIVGTGLVLWRIAARRPPEP